ncbi:MAG TPA: hypothetical protein VEC11_11990 [Allosphingosinicella sp.]|nr:hypothetical protein [Allosphingosinicella sp.]
MANWLKVLLGVLLSIGIFIGIMAWIVDMHPLRGDLFAEQRRCEEQSSYRVDGGTDCYETYRRKADAIETNEKWLGAGLGAGGAGLFWLLVYLFYIRPRRRAAASTGTPPPAG